MMKAKSKILFNKIKLYATPAASQLYPVASHQPVCSGFICVPSRFIGSAAEKELTAKILDLDLPEKKMTFHTCERIYEKWKKEKTKWIQVPESGVDAELCYVDTLDYFEKNGSKPTKTVMCIHGIPGNYGVFSYAIRDLTKEGIRVIVPSFLNSLYLPGKHKKELFRHSVEEKTQVFKDFLKLLNISKLDAIIAHSSAVYPTLRLILDPELEVRCQVLFNTGGHKRTVTMKPYWIIWTCSYLYLNPIGKLLVQKTGRFIMKHIMRTPIKEDNFDGVMLLAITMVNSEYWKTKEQFQEIAKRKVPTLYCFSEDDKVVEKKLTYEVINLFGASSENITYYDKNAHLATKGKDLSWLKLMSFEQGSHYVFRKYPEICNKEIIDLLKKIDFSEIK